MKRVIGIVVILLVIAIAEIGGSYYVGGLAEQKYRHLITLMNDTPGVQAEVVSYERSWFKSQAVVKIHSFEGTQLLPSTILHGPVIIDPSLTVPVQFQLAVLKTVITPHSPLLFGMPGPINLIMPFSFFGEIHFQLLQKPVDYQGNKIYISSQGLEGGGRISKNFDTYLVETYYPNVIVRENKEKVGPQVEFQGFKTDFKFQHLSDTEKRLEAHYELDKILGEQGLPGSLEALMMNHVLNIHPTMLDGEFEMGLKSIAFLTNQLGPGHIKIKFNNIDKAAAISLFKNGLMIQNKSNPPSAATGPSTGTTGPSPSTPPTAPSTDATTPPDLGKKNLIDLLSKRPHFTLEDFNVTLPEGTITAKGDIAIGGPEFNNVPDPDKISDILLQTLEGNFDAVMPKTLLRAMVKNRVAGDLSRDPQFQTFDLTQREIAIETQVNQFMAVLSKNGILNEKDTENYEIKLSFSKGHWMVEGKPVELPSATTPIPVPAPIIPPVTVPPAGVAAPQPAPNPEPPQPVIPEAGPTPSNTKPAPTAPAAPKPPTPPSQSQSKTK